MRLSITDLGRPQALRSQRGRALAAIVAQMSQALGSFALQLLAARLLGASGLGQFALVYSVIIMATAVGSGWVGDSLTILDRRQPPVRAALQTWGAFVPIVSGLVGAAAAYAAGMLTGIQAVLFGLAMTSFLLEDTMRRLLMASMRFWSLVAVDSVSLVVSLTTLGVAALVSQLSLSTFLLALLLGQVGGAIAAVPFVPPEDRLLVAWRPAALGEVARFGLWRAAQQSMRATMLTVARILITIAVGKALFGELEAARVYMAPALLVVQGLGSYLISSYARSREAPISSLAKRADRASLAMVSAALTMGVIATLGVPVLGPLVTGSSYSMDQLAVFGWAVYAASSAAVMPFASLAAVRGRQSLVVGLRFADSSLSILLLWVILFVTVSDVSWSPFALAAGSFAGGAAVRWLVLKPLCRNESRLTELASVAAASGAENQFRQNAAED